MLSLRRSALALAVAVTGWAAGCAITPHPMIDPGYAAPMFNTAPGLIAVGFSCCLVLAGRFVMNKIVNVDV